MWTAFNPPAYSAAFQLTAPLTFENFQMASAPLLIACLLFQRQFVQNFMRAGVR